MDKETFSSYGWIVITVIVLAIMITFATPFGDKIVEAVEDVVADFTGFANDAIDAVVVGAEAAESTSSVVNG